MPEKAPRPVPEGMNTVTTQLWFDGNCGEAIEFYKQAFGAEQLGHIAYGPDGKSVMHAMVRIGDTNIMMADAWPGQWETAPTDKATAGLFVYADDCDAWCDRAIEAGCESLYPATDMFWGDRMGKVKDPYGHCWGIATHKWVLTPEEVQKGQDEWLASMGTA